MTPDLFGKRSIIQSCHAYRGRGSRREGGSKKGGRGEGGSKEAGRGEGGKEREGGREKEREVRGRREEASFSLGMRSDNLPGKFINFTLSNPHDNSHTSGGFRGGSRGAREPPFEANSTLACIAG